MQWIEVISPGRPRHCFLHHAARHLYQVSHLPGRLPLVATPGHDLRTVSESTGFKTQSKTYCLKSALTIT